MEEGYDYDFAFSIRPDERFSDFKYRPAVNAEIIEWPGVRKAEGAAFLWTSDAGHHMEIRPEFRIADEGIGTRVEKGDQINCVHLFIPAQARGSALEKGYYRCALDLAAKLGWVLYDDTDSGCAVSPGSLETMFAESKPRPWWKIWA